MKSYKQLNKRLETLKELIEEDYETYDEYCNTCPPYLDSKWEYKDSRNTCVYNTFIKFGLPPKIVKY